MTFRILDLAARLLLALGLGCLLLAGFLSWRSLAFTPGVQSATGEVVSYREIADGDNTRYRPRVRFTTVTGEILTVEGQFFSTTKRFQIGERIPMLYPQRRPNEARVALFVDNWLGACIAAVVGLTGIAGGLLVRRSVRRELARTR
jgi:hypothetical protein